MKDMNPSIKEYFERFDNRTQERLSQIRMAIFELAPEATEEIKYQMPTAILHGNLIHYAAFKNHIGVYPLPTVIEKLKDDLKKYKQGKGSIQFQNEDPLPIDLIKKIIELRVNEKKVEWDRKNNPKAE